jgi:8-amino-7-oxononanoate synthase
MTTPLDGQLAADLAKLEQQALRRRLVALPATGPVIRVDGHERVNLASNDYLGLSGHPALREAAADAARTQGVGAGASRLVAGHLQVHAEVEQAFAALKHAEAALLLPTGFMANLAVLTALARPGDLLCLDRLDHASLIDAARASGATVRTYPHLDTAKLARLLARHHRDAPDARRFIVSDSVFSMDGDCADLPALADLAEVHDAVLVVDEAHATGVLGADGSGLAAAQGVADRVHVTISTASKALGGLGGIVTSSAAVIDTLVNRGRPLIYTTAVPPPQAAAIAAALRVVREEPQRRERVLHLARQVREHLAGHGWTLPQTFLPTPIIPLIVGDSGAALALAVHLREAGLLAVAIRPPTVPPGSARVRLSLRADLTDAHCEQLLRAIPAR